MKCHECESTETKVIESRESKSGDTIRRRRECINCGSRFTTFERREEQPIYIIKKDGSRELFDEQKLRKSITIALQKRPISAEILESITKSIEKMCRQDGFEVTSQKVGEYALEVLLKVDPVAYVRFASVYRAFSNPEDFAKELNKVTDQYKLKNNKIKKH